jgi:hypothetical protein
MNDGLDERLVFAPARAGDGARGRIERLADGMAALGYVNDNEGARSASA